MQNFEMPWEAIWTDFRGSSVSTSALPANEVPWSGATTNQSRIQRSDRVVMFAEARGRSEVNATDGDLECSSKVDPRCSYFRMGIRVVLCMSASLGLRTVFAVLVLAYPLRQTDLYLDALEQPSDIFHAINCQHWDKSSD